MSISQLDSLRQIDGDLINHWYILALDLEVPRFGAIRRMLYDTPYVLFRDEAGEVAVLLDKCMHRGAQLSLGKVENGQVRCPYHGWKFDRAGQLVEVPSDGPSTHTESQLRARRWCLPKVHYLTQDGCVWIWTGEAAPQTARPAWRFPFFRDPLVTGYFMITDFDNEVTHLVQNFMDVPHTVFVHAKWFRSRALLKVPAKFAVAGSRLKISYEQPHDSIGFTERILNPGGAPMTHTDEFIFPNITRVDYRFGEKFFIINSECSPISRFRSRVYTWIAYDVGFLSPWIKPFMQFYTRKVINQDVEIMKNQGDNLRLFAGLGQSVPDFRSTGADELYVAIDRMRHIGTQDRTEPAKINYTREREFWI